MYSRTLARPGAFAFVAKRGSAATRGTPEASKTEVKRICPEFRVAVPVWHCWQVGSSSQPVRVAALPRTALSAAPSSPLLTKLTRETALFPAPSAAKA